MFCLLAVGARDANAEVGAPTPTVQAVAANATWLAYTPPPEHPGIVCMVDSGVDPNPDTEAAVIGGQALAPETETNDEIARLEPRAQPGNHPNGHGTLMAMMMAAPINGWGMVGIAPTSVRVYNMKALPKGETTFPFNYYAVATRDCQRLRSENYPSLSVINLSLGGIAKPSASELTGLENDVSIAHLSGLDVVAAAGNEGGPLLYPAAFAPILAVGAGDAGSGPGALCPFASRGEGLDVVAPGCDSQAGGLEGAFEDDGSPAVGSGSSQASAIVSAVLASMRAYNTQLSFAQAEGCLTSTARSGSIDVSAAFYACGLSQIVIEGEAAERAAANNSGGESSSNSQTSSVTISLSECITVGGCPNSSSSSSSLSGPFGTSGFESKMRCARPKIADVANHDGHLVLQIHGRLSGCRLQARLLIRRGPGASWHLTPSVSSTRLVLPKGDFSRLQARCVRGSEGGTASGWVGINTKKSRS